MSYGNENTPARLDSQNDGRNITPFDNPPRSDRLWSCRRTSTMQSSEPLSQPDVLGATGFDQVVGQRGDVQNVAFQTECQQPIRLITKCLVSAAAGEFGNEVQVAEIRNRD